MTAAMATKPRTANGTARGWSRRPMEASARPCTAASEPAARTETMASVYGGRPRLISTCAGTPSSSVKGRSPQHCQLRPSCRQRVATAGEGMRSTHQGGCRHVFGNRQDRYGRIGQAAASWGTRRIWGATQCAPRAQGAACRRCSPGSAPRPPAAARQRQPHAPRPLHEAAAADLQLRGPGLKSPRVVASAPQAATLGCL